jgi:hypothetical protein
LPGALAGLLELLAFVLQAFLIFGLFHSLLEFLGIPEDLLLLILQPFQAAFDFFPLGLGLGFLKGRLQLLDAVVQIVLPLGQFAKAVEHLAVLGLLLRLRRLERIGFALRFVAVFLFPQLQLLKLLLGTAVRALAGALALLLLLLLLLVGADDFVLASP